MHKTKIMTKLEIIREFDHHILVQKEYIKGYQQLDFDTDTEERLALKTMEMLEELKAKIIKL